MFVEILGTVMVVTEQNAYNVFRLEVAQCTLSSVTQRKKYCVAAHEVLHRLYYILVFVSFVVRVSTGTVKFNDCSLQIRITFIGRHSPLWLREEAVILKWQMYISMSQIFSGRI